MMRHHSRDLRRRRWGRLASAAVAIGAIALLLSPAAADDRDLLRFDSAKPYLFIILDTSASMAMKMGEDEWAPGGADGPDSRLYQAKQALYNVLRDVNDVHFGFAGFDQDHVRVVTKHWLYYNEQVLPTSWPIDFPRPDLWDSDGDTSVLTWTKAVPPVDAEGDPLPIDPNNPPDEDTRVSEIGRVDTVTGELTEEADLLTFGAPLGDPVPDALGRVVGGSCAAPLQLDDPQGRARVQSLAISSTNATWFWVSEGNRRFLMRIARPSQRPDASGTLVPNLNIGEDRLHVRLQLWRVQTCATIESLLAARSNGDHDIRLNLRIDPELSQFLYVNEDTWGPNGSEAALDLWQGSDVLSDALFPQDPHTGLGWEGNYDSDVVTGDPTFDQNVTDDDFACPPFTSCAAANVKPMAPTAPGPQRAEDSGDMLPFHWTFDHKDALLTRLDPFADDRSDPEELGDFRLARHFADTPVSGLLPLRDPGEIPLLAADLSPLGRAITDLRCWMLGDAGRGSNKCKDGMWGVANTPGWMDVACEKDTAFGCRKLFTIIISDGEDSIAGNDATSSVSDLDGMAGMRIWALNVGDPSGCDRGGGLHPIVQTTVGECINVATQERLRQVLESLLGQIRTTARSFASAAVPSVQATVEQKIYLTSFLPFNDAAVWKGSVHSFLKPLPVSSSGVPLTEQKCDGSGSIAVDDPTQGCHLWDAGEMLVEKQFPASGNDFLDLDDLALRRVFYAMQTEAEGDWPRRMRLFDPLNIVDSTDPGPQQVRFDLWRGLGIGFSTNESDPSVNAPAQNSANGLILGTLKARTGTEINPDPNQPPITHQYLLGDIFHSTPVVIGTPANNIYFAVDLYGDPDAACDPDDGTASANPGYRCFFQKQRFRRKMLLVGSNDGMLHAFDAGIFREGGTDHWTGVDLVDPDLSPFGSFDNGTGKELFAYVPRLVLPLLDDITPADTKHAYTVDGTVTVADVFIDPVHQDGSTFPLEADREWRTVAVGGLREAGSEDVSAISSGYYALDVTQPDPVVEHDDLAFVPVTAESGDNDPDTGDFVPVCTAGLTELSNSGGILAPPSVEGCGPVAFPAPLWEFGDTFFDESTRLTWYADADSPLIFNGEPDLGATWSTPNVGRIRVCSVGGTACDPTPADATGDDDLIDLFVAVVGGGMDPANKAHDWRPLATPNKPADAVGNWLYILDVETGEAIYKRELVGAAPSEPAAVDTDSDGYLDRIYIGTLAGYLYRVDLDEVIGAEGNEVLPALEMAPVVYKRPGLTLPQLRIVSRPRILAPAWEPKVLFDANFDGSVASADPRPIYQRPSVIFDAQTGQYVLAFGTGDREDLWAVETAGPSQRFYVFRDSFDSAEQITTPMNEAGLAPILPDAAGVGNANLLTTNGGWVMQLAPAERVITDAFALSGVTVFSTFVPQIVDGQGEEVVAGCEDVTVGKPSDSSDDGPVCSKQGLSHIFVVNTTNANGLLFEADNTAPTRYKIAPTFVTNPFAEPGQTKDTIAGNEEGEHTADDLSVNMVQVMDSLKQLFPPQCKFANYRIDLKTVAADTSLQFIAPIPVCLIESNWKEF